MSRKLTEEQVKERTRKRTSYVSNLNQAKSLRGYSVPDIAIYPILMKLHYLKRYKYGRNVIFAEGSIKLLAEDIENKIVKL